MHQNIERLRSSYFIVLEKNVIAIFVLKPAIFSDL
jgi:hypothetical protein